MRTLLQRIVWPLATALFIAGWMWVLLPPVPRERWPIQGDKFDVSADGRRLVTVAMTWVKRQFTGTLSGGGPPPAERCDLHVYDVAIGRELATFTLDKAEIWPPALSADGRRLAAVTIWGSKVHEWDIDTGQAVARYGPEDLADKENWVQQLRYSPAGELLALVKGQDQRRVLWHCRERRIVAELNGKDDFSPNDPIVPGFFIAQSGPEQWKIWRLDTGAFIGAYQVDPESGFRSPPDRTLSHDGRLMAFGCRDFLRLTHADGTIRELRPLNAESRPLLSPTNRYLTAFSFDDLRKRKPPLWETLRILQPPDRWATLRLYDLTNGREIAAFPKGNQACFSPDERSLLVLSENQMVEIWDIPPGPPWLHIAEIGLSAGVLVWLVGAARRWRASRSSSHAQSVSPHDAIDPTRKACDGKLI